MPWNSTTELDSRKYTCGYCDRTVASARGFIRNYDRSDVKAQKVRHTAFSMICPHCDLPTYFQDDKQVPSPTPGQDVPGLPQDLDALYREARNCCSVGAFTASVLTCRKLLMNIAVASNAKVGLRFIEYVEHLAATGYIPPNGKPWVDHIRQKGNEATHEIALMSRQDAEDLLSFVEMLMRFIYEFPNRVPKPSP